MCSETSALHIRYARRICTVKFGGSISAARRHNLVRRLTMSLCKCKYKYVCLNSRERTRHRNTVKLARPPPLRYRVIYADDTRRIQSPTKPFSQALPELLPNIIACCINFRIMAILNTKSSLYNESLLKLNGSFLYKIKLYRKIIVLY